MHSSRRNAPVAQDTKKKEQWLEKITEISCIHYFKFKNKGIY